MKLATSLLLTASAVVLGQPANDTQQPKYDVATIKRIPDTDFRFALRYSPSGALNATGVTLKMLVMEAYGIEGFRVLGGPTWFNSQKWDIQAQNTQNTQVKLDSPAAARDQREAMLRTLLEERFHLAARREQQKVPVYQLSIAKGGPRLKGATGDGRPSVREGVGNLDLKRATMATLARFIGLNLSRPVIDKTGLPGDFDVNLHWTPQPGEGGGPAARGFAPGTPEPPVTDSSGPGIFTAIREQLELQLKAGKALSTVIVVDSAELATEN